MRYIIVLFIAMIMTFSQDSSSYGESIQEETYQRLDKIRTVKKQQLFDYLEKIRKNADAIGSDNPMSEFFYIKNRYYQLQKTTPPPETLLRKISELKKKIRDHYLRNYSSFYDILFINKDGDIFYTIRQQSDYHENLFEGELAQTALAQQLKKHPMETFVDYQYYAISDEPSAFFVVPVLKDGHFAGWFVLQCAINKINSMFTQEEGLGATGEVFLVNKQHYMLTDSRFYGDSSILKKHLSYENIAAKFREKAGHKIVVDYRGVRALSSFEVCRISNSEWLLITKIDEDEITTEQYKKKREESRQHLILNFQEQNRRYCSSMPIDRKPVEVDMDEFRKVHKKELICTYGVSSCTVVIVSFPEKFSYMSHISNLDRMYGGDTTDLIGHIFKRVNTFDIYKHELRKLQAIVVANHFEAVMNIIDRLVDAGIFLSQIKFIYNPDAHYGNVLHDYVNSKTLVEWVMDREAENKLRQCAAGVKSLGDMLKPLIGYGFPLK